MEGEKLTFARLDAKIEELEIGLNQEPALSKGQSLLMLIGLAAMLLALLAAKFLPISERYTQILVASLFVVEIVSVVAMVYVQRKEIFQSFPAARRAYARDLDVDLPRHHQLIQWLRGFAADDLKALQNYACYRHDRMKDRIPMLIGTMQNLGLLPVLIAVYLQLKDFQWPVHINWITIVAVPLLGFLYWNSVSVVSVRWRVQLYQTLLGEALENDGPRGSDEELSLATLGVD